MKKLYKALYYTLYGIGAVVSMTGNLLLFLFDGIEYALDILAEKAGVYD